MPSLLEAIRDKYCGTNGLQDESSNDGMICQFVTFKRNETNFVENRKQVPPILVLNNYQIGEIGDDQELKDTCKGTVELDLTCNELRDWNEVHKLMLATPRLNFLNLSYNNLSEPIPSPAMFQDKEIPMYSTLSTLILVGTSISWSSIWTLLQEMRQLEELHLSKNNFTTIEVGGKEDEVRVKPELKRIVFNDNPIEAWTEVNKIGKCFPCLEHLGLSETLLSAIDPESHQYFAKLKSLYLSETKLNEMTNVTHLQKFPALVELRLQGSSLFCDLSAHERRQLTIALLPNVAKLNGTTISAIERDTSERAFIRYFDQLHMEGNKPERYDQLMKAHGKLEPLVEIDLKPVTKVKLSFIFEDKKVCKVVKVYQTTSELKNYARKLFGIDSMRFRLFYQNMALAEGCGFEEMRFPQKYLYTYNPTDGDEIHLIPFATKPCNSCSDYSDKNKMNTVLAEEDEEEEDDNG